MCSHVRMASSWLARKLFSCSRQKKGEPLFKQPIPSTIHFPMFGVIFKTKFGHSPKKDPGRYNTQSYLKHVFSHQAPHASGTKLREILMKEGSLAAMDVTIRKTHSRTLDELKGGGWYTKTWLMQNRAWNKFLS